MTRATTLPLLIALFRLGTQLDTGAADETGRTATKSTKMHEEWLLLFLCFFVFFVANMNHGWKQRRPSPRVAAALARLASPTNLRSVPAWATMCDAFGVDVSLLGVAAGG